MERYGENHPDTLQAMHSLAITLTDIGKCDEAIQMNEFVLDRRILMLGEKHPNTLQTMNSLALMLEHCNRVNEAIELKKKVIKLTSSSKEINLKDYILSVESLASTYENLGKYKDAYNLYK